MKEGYDKIPEHVLDEVIMLCIHTSKKVPRQSVKCENRKEPHKNSSFDFPFSQNGRERTEKCRLSLVHS